MKNNNDSDTPKPALVMTLSSEMNKHDHDYTQIVIGLSGKAEFEVSGVGNFIGAGQGCVVNASSQHAFGGIGKSDILVLNMPLMKDYDPLVLQKLNELGKKDIYFQLDNQIKNLIAMLADEMRNSPDDELLSRACNDTVIALLQRHLKSFQALQKNGRIDMDSIDRYIEKHLNHKITVTQLAGCVFLGESQFHMLFKEQAGITPHQYVLGKRIDMAKGFIEQGNFSLGHVAELTGFSGQSSFTHTFSRLQGISPSVYKKRLLNKR